jgi:predicted Rossmann-fold nucleotide-binding protein
VLIGRDFWSPLTAFVRNRLLVEGTIDPGDEQRLQLTDSPEEAVEWVTSVAMRRFGLTYGPQVRRRWYLGE